MAAKRDDIVQRLRDRVLSGLASGRLVQGDRLPSARDLAAELSADPRVVLSAYRVLAADGLVELRQRSGIFVSAPARPTGVPILSAPWLVDVLTEAVTRGVPALEVPRWIKHSLESVRLRAIVVSSTVDQVVGMVGELRESFGVDAVGVEIDAVADYRHTGPSPDFLITTAGVQEAGRALAATLGVPVMLVGVRSDLVGGEWRAMLAGTAYVVVCDARFGATVQAFFKDTPGAENLRVLVVDRDDLSTIPAGAPTYLTRAARERIGRRELAGRAVTSARVFDAASVREILAVVVRANLAALERRQTAPR